MPRVSVIIPAYNCASVLPEAVGSVRAQPYRDWEVVICDDGSADDTAAVADALGDGVHVVRNQRNLGPAAARNLAIDAASGELLAFLDADDRWLPSYLTDQVGLYDSANSEMADVGIVACDALIIGPDGQQPHTYRDRVPFPEPLTLAKLLVANPIFTGALVPRPVVAEVGGFSTECFGTEDYDLWIRVLELGYRAIPNPKALVMYRVTESSVSAHSFEMAQNTQVVYRRALRRGRLGLHERWIARRELRVQKLITHLRAERSFRWFLQLVGLAVVVVAQNPQRWPRVINRLFSRDGALRDRLFPGREADLA